MAVYRHNAFPLFALLFIKQTPKQLHIHVLVKEINNSDSRKYAILTTTDSFYRYKEAVKELLDRNLQENDMSRLKLLRELEEVRQKKMKDEENAGKVKDPRKTDGLLDLLSIASNCLSIRISVSAASSHIAAARSSRSSFIFSASSKEDERRRKRGKS